jgi:hypothetical protein
MAASLKPPPLNTGPPATAAPPLALTIRFSASVPDLELDIPKPSQTTVISMKHLIRGRLTEPNSQRRLRFIQGGKILPDGAALSSVLRAPPPPPPTTTPSTPRLGFYDDGSGKNTAGGGDGGGGGDDPRGKGKGVANRPPPQQRIYVNCSIGDSLTDAELRAEAEAASAPVSEAPSPGPRSPFLAPGTPVLSNHHAPTPMPGGLNGNGGTNNTSSTARTPRGFDRLLAAGFSAAEVNQLRLQFRSIHSARYTPDTLPSPDSFRRMEDAWIDDNGAAAAPTSGGGSGGGFGGGASEDTDDGGLVGTIDAMIWGMMVGFLWPLGSFGWLAREPGIHSDRWKVMVGAGVFLSLLIGIVRSIQGGDR